MKSFRRVLSMTMAVVFVLMSACLILQAGATQEDVPPCHAPDPANNGNTEKAVAMERCCQAGVLKTTQKFTADLHIIDFLPTASVAMEQPSFHFRRIYQNQSLLLFPPTRQRLAELSFLRI